MEPQVVQDYRGRKCVSISEAGRRAGVTKEAIRQAIRRGVLDKTVIGPHLHLVTLASLAKYVPDPTHAHPLKPKRRRRRVAA